MVVIQVAKKKRMQFNKEQRERLLAMRRQQREAPKSSSLLAVRYSVRALIKTVPRAARSIFTIMGPYGGYCPIRPFGDYVQCLTH